MSTNLTSTHNLTRSDKVRLRADARKLLMHWPLRRLVAMWGFSEEVIRQVLKQSSGA